MRTTKIPEPTSFQRLVEDIVTNGLGYDGVNPLRRKRDKRLSDQPGQLQLHLARMGGRLDAKDPQRYFEQLPQVMEELGYQLCIEGDIFCTEFKSAKVSQIIGERECLQISCGFGTQYWVKEAVRV